MFFFFFPQPGSAGTSRGPGAPWGEVWVGGQFVCAGEQQLPVEVGEGAGPPRSLFAVLPPWVSSEPPGVGAAGQDGGCSLRPG